MTTNWQKEVGIDKQRKHTLAIANLYLGRKTMAKQAKTLTQQELRRVLDYTATRKHSVRNRALLMTTHLSGTPSKRRCANDIKPIEQTFMS